MGAVVWGSLLMVLGGLFSVYWVAYFWANGSWFGFSKVAILLFALRDLLWDPAGIAFALIFLYLRAQVSVMAKHFAALQMLVPCFI